MLSKLLAPPTALTHGTYIVMIRVLRGTRKEHRMNVWDYLVIRLKNANVYSTGYGSVVGEIRGFDADTLDMLDDDDYTEAGDIQILQEMPIDSPCGAACVGVIDALVGFLEATVDVNGHQQNHNVAPVIGHHTIRVVVRAIEQCAILIRG